MTSKPLAHFAVVPLQGCLQRRSKQNQRRDHLIAPIAGHDWPGGAPVQAGAAIGSTKHGLRTIHR